MTSRLIKIYNDDLTTTVDVDYAKCSECKSIVNFVQGNEKKN